MLFVVVGILQAGDNRLLMVVLLALGAGFLFWFFLHIRARERSGKEPLLSTELFRNRTSNLGLVTQNIQWLLLLGISFVVSVFLQTVRGYNAIQTGVIFTAATVGILVSSLGAERFAGRRTQKSLILAGFVTTIAGIGLLIGLVVASDAILAFVPGLLLIGLGVGVMLTPSVNVVQSAFPEDQQGDLRAVAQCLQPGLVARHRHRRHHPGVRPGSGEPVLCAGDGLPGRHRAHRHGGRTAAPVQSRATAGLTPAPGPSPPRRPTCPGRRPTHRTGLNQHDLRRRRKAHPIFCREVPGR